MSKISTLPPGDAIRKAVEWLGVMQLDHPEISRAKVLAQAQLRFNLSPKECEFLDKNFSTPTPEKI